MPCGFEATDIDCPEGATASYDPVEESFTLMANDCSGYPNGEYSLVKTELCGDGEIVVHVASLNGDGRVGLIMMETADSEARFVSNIKDLSIRTRTEYRSSTGGNISFKSKNRRDVDWLRIVRAGSKFKTYTSTDGSYWKLAHSITFSNFEECIYAGLVLYTKNANVPVTAVLDQFKITGDNYQAFTQLPGGPAKGIEEETQQVESSNLQSTIRLEAAPNPFSTRTQINLSLAAATNVTLEIFNLHGQRVQRLENTKLDAGNHRYHWDGTTTTNQALPTGIYLLRMRVDQKWFTTKLSLINR
ncbi:MAG: T9SS type A sorting domain-containing protein [Saprospiraceae bacterium]|nr:T9SS type A sorting domain-containing protein [Saprospiraceae bacterium]